MVLSKVVKQNATLQLQHVLNPSKIVFWGNPLDFGVKPAQTLSPSTNEMKEILEWEGGNIRIMTAMMCCLWIPI